LQSKPTFPVFLNIGRRRKSNGKKRDMTKKKEGGGRKVQGVVFAVADLRAIENAGREGKKKKNKSRSPLPEPT